MSNPDDWMTNGGSLWSTASNWDAGVPTSSSDVYLGTNSGAANVGSNADVTINTLKMRSGDTLSTNSGLFDVTNGMPFGLFGSITIVNSGLRVDNGTINNSGTITMRYVSGTTNDVDTNLVIGGSVQLNGAGSIVFSGGNAGLIGGNAASIFTNADNNISGDGMIGELFFTNRGTIETNNSTGAHTLRIWGSAVQGKFDNEGSVFADNGGTLVLGLGGNASTIINNGTIGTRPSALVTTVEIAGNVTIQGTGQVLLGGGFSNIVSDGNSASLTLDGVTLGGEGAINDAKLTLTVDLGAEVTATGNLNPLVVNTGANTINNAGKMDAGQLPGGASGSLLDIQSAVHNTGLVQAQSGNFVTFDAAGTTNAATGIIDADGGTIAFSKSVTNNGGVLEAERGGSIIVESSIIGLNNSQIKINAGGLLDLATDGTVSQGVTFTGSRAVLELDQNGGQVGTNISGINAGDSIDLKFLLFAAGDHLLWNGNGVEGLLSVLSSNGSFLASVAVAGSWNTQDFGLTTDGSGGCWITVLPTTVHSDFVEPRTSEILFRNDGSGDTGFYKMSNGANIGWVDIGASSTAYSVVAVGDFTGNATDDILFRSSTTGDTGFYQMSSGNNIGWVDVGASSTGYNVVGTGDFDGNATDDILFRNSATGDTGYYAISNGANLGWHDVGASSTAYSVVGVGDFTGNGAADILFRNNSTGDTGFYNISNGANAGWVDVGASSTAYSVVGIGDFIGNGTDDILFRNNATGDMGFYQMTNGANAGWHDIGPSSTAYSVVGIGDYNSSGTDSILFRNATTGDTGFYAMSNGASAGWVDVGASSTAYHVVS
jgi:hypothetical protein